MATATRPTSKRRRAARPPARPLDRPGYQIAFISQLNGIEAISGDMTLGDAIAATQGWEIAGELFMAIIPTAKDDLEGGGA